ncbi:MAG: co-chaperone GroES [Gemmatimonadetes bacterium]|nr:co-chaperone GroES [Gemmatimonadota bacterium]MYC12845.1 co-chaperone GroES [Gemmatimonadota bacterium]MYK54408.1 co-chaperone GroES [Gemmatimonadota bacterium]
MNVRPLSDRILVRRVDAEEQVKGGIIIPDTAKETPQEAEVVAVGPGKRNKNGDVIAPAVKSGEKILIGKYAGTEIEVDGDEYVIVNEDDVLGIIQ